MSKIIINLNDFIECKPTKVGWRLLYDYWRKTMIALNNPDVDVMEEIKKHYKVDKEGNIKMQLHECMNIFGDSMCYCNNLPIDMNVKYEIKEI